MPFAAAFLASGIAAFVVGIALGFPALRVQNIHPSHLPWCLRYLGLFRWQAFLGQLDSNRTFAHPWIAGQIVSFKPLPNFEFGLTHTIDFGGSGNDAYGFAGFLGRATGFNTGSPLGANTNSRVSVYARARIQRWRGAQGRPGRSGPALG